MTAETLDYRIFLSKVEPFSALVAERFEKVVENIDIQYFRQGDVIMQRGQEPEFFYIIAKGLVEEIDEDENSLFYAVQDSFDAASLLQNRNRNQFQAAEETLCFALRKEIFLQLIKLDASFESYYLYNLSEKMNALLERGLNKEMATFMATRVSDCVIHPPVFVHHSTTIFDAVKVMSEKKSDSLIVQFDDGGEGLVTNTDLREKVILPCLSYETPIGDIVVRKLITIDESDFLFNALLILIEYTIKRVIVHRNGETVGVLEQIDLLSSISSKAHLTNMQIQKASSVEELRDAASDIIYLIKSLQQQGVKVRHITKLLGDLNTKTYRKLFELVAPQEIIDNSALMILGSEGRKEQTLRTDQDNALVLRNGFEHPELESVMRSFTDSLISFGFPECPGGVMVINPYWCKSLSAYENELARWVQEPGGDNAMNFAILIDASYVAGDEKLYEGLREVMLRAVRNDNLFFANFAKNALIFETPLSLFSNFVTEKRGHRDELDIKKGAIFPIVHGVRSLALEHRLQTTNTIDRIKELNDKGVIDTPFATELIEAISFLLGLRLRIHLEKHDRDKVIDNYVNPNQLNNFERDLLRDVFKIVERFKKYITHHFKLNMVR
ncbi:putative nucleotidyltransferase substrate binding domain-containing protein [Desulfurispira natronophila]|uniref:CBS domain-containing protein n=1 Tax=Desulfurispira natronophila TaxID=682562 RepID=A0A7W7Y3M4_9BACT|nr:putative nucleotidyltransferase substrate binding domain-containing protein [Desulfurispira natronophila]MBB5021470.1 CBS domain-containing protein [Desulfurispira natronophila]